MSSPWIYLAVSVYFLSWLLIPWVLLKKSMNPTAAVAWIMSVAFLPYLGAVLLLLFGVNRIERRKRFKQAASERINRQIPSLPDRYDPVNQLSELQQQLAVLAERVSSTWPTAGNEVQLLPEAELTFQLFEEEILAARQSIHVEYYIWRPDRIGTKLRDLLIRKAQEGIEVRFLYDSFGSLFLGSKFLRPMSDAGVAVAPFLPGRSLRERWSINLRNHRKLLIIDGHVGFTGGMNVGDEHLGLNPAYGRWRDTQLKVRGPAVLQLQQVFVEDWYYATGEELTGSAYFPEAEHPGNAVAQVIFGGPHADVAAFLSLMFAGITRARKGITLATSYFVPPTSLAMALETAARQGVRVRLLVAKKANFLWTLLAGRSYYSSLLEAGAEIYEYQDGFFHAKTLTVDGQWSLVGSPNFDARSLVLNFEVGLAIYSQCLARELEEQFERDVQRSTRVDPAAWADRSTWQMLGEQFCRLFGPIL